VLVFVYEARPEILYGYRREMGAKGRMSRKRTAIVLAVLALVIGGVVSLFASASPDGLEWSMEKVAGTTELLADGRLYELAEKVQGLTALLPDYGFQASESAAGTSFSGIVGGVAVLAVCLSVCLAIKRAKQAELKKRNAVNESN